MGRGSTKWTIYIQGGGWCYDEKDCYKRSQTNLGSSKYFPENPHYCFMSPHMQSFIQTPFFMFNSKYDAWQLNHILGESRFDTEEAQSAVLQYGDDFLQQFEPVR